VNTWLIIGGVALILAILVTLYLSALEDVDELGDFDGDYS
jgi:hypothetical protein